MLTRLALVVNRTKENLLITAALNKMTRQRVIVLPHLLIGIKRSHAKSECYTINALTNRQTQPNPRYRNHPDVTQLSCV